VQGRSATAERGRPAHMQSANSPHISRYDVHLGEGLDRRRHQIHEHTAHHYTPTSPLNQYERLPRSVQN
jgi:hypothetical protein